MKLNNYIQFFPKAIPSTVCAQIITFLLEDIKSGKAKDGVVSSSDEVAYRGDEFLISKDVNIGQEDNWIGVNNFLHETYLKHLLMEYAEYAEINYLWDIKMHAENAIASQYVQNRGHFAPHQDESGSCDYLRSLTVIIYLNDVIRGGETEFLNLYVPIGNAFGVDVEERLSFSPSTGGVLIFPSNFIFSHQGKVPRSNDKFLIVSFAEIEIRPDGRVFKK